MKKLLIFGAGGHGKVCADCAVQMGYTDIEFLDDGETEKTVLGFPVSGRISDTERYDKDRTAVFVAIGNNKIRLNFIEKYSAMGYETVTLVHPSAVVSKYAEVESGVLIMPGVIINAGAKIGVGAIINTGARIDHDCFIGKCVHVSPGAVLSGTVTVSDETWICAGAVIGNNVRVGTRCVVAAGAAVTCDVDDFTMVAGVPAAVKKYLRPKEGTN